MKNLLIGNTSQLSSYFSDEFVKISSRNIDFSYLKKHKWDKIILSFGESRKFINDISIYHEINFLLTIKIIEELHDFCNSIIVYSTCELWNKYDGKVNISMPFSYYETPYLNSKYKLTCEILNRSYNNVFIVFPFNFNSPLRSSDFLFGKIFDSIINKKKVNIGDTYFYRDIIHPEHVVKESINCTKHKMIGSGRLTFVNDFIRDLYLSNDSQYEILVKENIKNFKEKIDRKEYYMESNSCLYDYNSLLLKTNQDIARFKCLI